MIIKSFTYSAKALRYYCSAWDSNTFGPIKTKYGQRETITLNDIWTFSTKWPNYFEIIISAISRGGRLYGMLSELRIAKESVGWTNALANSEFVYFGHQGQEIDIISKDEGRIVAHLMFMDWIHLTFVFLGDAFWIP